jgi:hypothetical protein
MSRKPSPSIPIDVPTSSRPVNLKDGDLVTAVPLDDFMHEVAIVLRLPKRQVTRPVAVVQPSPTARRWTLRAVALSVAVATLAAAVGISRFGPTPKPEPLPVELRGEWRTQHPSYRERVLSFTADRVGLSMAEAEVPSLHPVTALTTRVVFDTTIVALTYEDDGGPVDFRVSLVRGSAPQLRLSNPPGVVWEPAGATSRPKGTDATRAAAGVRSSEPASANGAKDAHPWEHAGAPK